MCRLTPSKVRVRLGLDAEWHRTDSVRSGLWEKKSGCRPQSTPEPFTFYAKSLQQPPHIVLNITPQELTFTIYDIIFPLHHRIFCKDQNIPTNRRYSPKTVA